MTEINNINNIFEFGFCNDHDRQKFIKIFINIYNISMSCVTNNNSNVTINNIESEEYILTIKLFCNIYFLQYLGGHLFFRKENPNISNIKYI